MAVLSWLLNQISFLLEIMVAALWWLLGLALAITVLWRIVSPFYRAACWLLSPIVALIRRLRRPAADVYQWELQGSPQLVASTLLRIADQVGRLALECAQRPMRFALRIEQPATFDWNMTAPGDQAVETYEALVREWVAFVEVRAAETLVLTVRIDVLPVATANRPLELAAGVFEL